MGINKYINAIIIGLVMAGMMTLTGCAKTSAEPEKEPVEEVTDIEVVSEDKVVSSDETEEEDTTGSTMLNVETEDAVAYSEIPVEETEEQDLEEPVIVEEEKDPFKRTEDGKIIVDLVMFMGQSNMSGAGGNASYAPSVPKDHGYEFRAISDPTRLYPITEPFGANENNYSAIKDAPVGRQGSMVSAFANSYYEETGVPIVAVSSSSGGTDTAFWMNPLTVADFTERQKRAQVWLESNDYYIRKQYVIWLQGESDALKGVTTEQYNQNMDNIIRPLFIGGVQKVFIITPGRTITDKNYFNDILRAQINMCKTSGYYALATTILNMVSTEYMIDEWHYNQTVLNLIGSEAAKSAAYYTNNRREMCIYNYKDNEVYIPEGYEYSDDEMKVEPVDYNTNGDLKRY